MKKTLMTIAMVLLFIASQAQFRLNGYIDQPISCYGNNDASIQITAYPLNSNIYTTLPLTGVTYKNTNINTNESSTNNSGFFNKLEPGNYLTCAHLNGDSLCYIFNIVEAIPLSITFNDEIPLSCDTTNGSLSIDISGGTCSLQPYLTRWVNINNPDSVLNCDNNFAITIDGLGEGTYKVYIEDDNGCFYNKSYTLWKQGDVNHDSNIDLLDLLMVENDVNNFIFGEHLETDLNKDGNVNLMDLSMEEELVRKCN